MSNYTTKQGETIVDVCLNATGSVNNWAAILEANGFTEWVPALFAGQIIIIPDAVEVQTNVLREMQRYPACNNPGVNNLEAQIQAIIDLFAPPLFAFEDDVEKTFEDETEFIFENA